MRTNILAALLTLAVSVTTVVLTDAAAVATLQARTGDPDCRDGTAFVMGAAQYDGTPSPVFRRRLDAALELYEQGCVSQIVVSGGGQPGDATTEADTGLAYFSARAVPESAIAIEPTATSTYEAVRRGLPEIEARPIVVVTDAYHGRRAAWMFQQFGEDVDLTLVPSGGASWTHYVREVAAMFVYRLAYGWPWIDSHNL